MALFLDDVSMNTVLGPGSMFRGDMKINGLTRIDGDLDGNIETAGRIIIGETARIRGNISAKAVTVIGGIIQGNISAPENVTLLSSAVVLGDIQTKHFKADDDVFLNGHCIALSQDEAYAHAVEVHENEVAIASRALLEKADENTFIRFASDTESSVNNASSLGKPRGLFGGTKKKVKESEE